MTRDELCRELRQQQRETIKRQAAQYNREQRRQGRARNTAEVTHG